jgi:hypothetical protein
MAIVETTNRNEAVEMRKIRNHRVSIENPALLFARGVESIISDPLIHPSRHDAGEIDTIRRGANKQESRGNLFSTLLRQFANL